MYETIGQNPEQQNQPKASLDRARKLAEKVPIPNTLRTQAQNEMCQAVLAAFPEEINACLDNSIRDAYNSSAELREIFPNAEAFSSLKSLSTYISNNPEEVRQRILGSIDIFEAAYLKMCSSNLESKIGLDVLNELKSANDIMSLGVKIMEAASAKIQKGIDDLEKSYAKQTQRAVSKYPELAGKSQAEIFQSIEEKDSELFTSMNDALSTSIENSKQDIQVMSEVGSILDDMGESIFGFRLSAIIDRVSTQFEKVARNRARSS